MRYNEVNSKRFGELNIVTSIEDEDSVFEVSLIVKSDIFGKVRANYDLTVYGDIDVDTLVVMGNLICFGNCKANEVSIQGTCKIFGQLEVNDGIIADDLSAADIETVTLSVNGNLVCNSLNYENCVTCTGKIIALDGVMGSGKLDCAMVICGEYAAVDDEVDLLIASELENSLRVLQEKKTLLEQENNQILELENVEYLGWDECEQYLKRIAEIHPEFTEEYRAYTRLFAWTEHSKICNLKQYILLMKDIFQAGDLTKNSDLYKVVKEDLYEKANAYVFDLPLPSLNQMEFADLLNTVIINRGSISIDIYDYLIEAIYNKIGLKHSTVQLMLEE